jgi:hypothetical protein
MAGLLGAPRDSNGGAAAIPARQADAGIVVLPADPAHDVNFCYSSLFIVLY